MKTRIFAAVIVSLLISCWLSGFTFAVQTTQTIAVRPGWNAVFLEVEPMSKDPAAVFSGVVGLQSVWMWNPRTDTVEFIQNPSTLVPEQPQWMVYYPGNPILTNLYAINGETPYLIHIGAGAPDPQYLNVQGEPSLPYIDWKANSFNFVGFHLTAGQEPYFEDFFSSSLAHNGQEIHTLDNATGEWIQVTNPTVQMKQGEGFWVYCKGSSEFTGPLSVQLQRRDGLHYGNKLSEQDVFLFNNSEAQKTISLSEPSIHDALYYWVFKPEDQVAGWVAFPSSLDVTIPAGQSQKLRLGVKRAGLAADTSYAANMTVTDNEGMRIVLPVSVTGISYSGLWVGNATITKVSEPANAVTPDKPLKTGSEFSFRLIVHVDNSGTVRLLSQVIQMWQEGTWKPDPNDLGKLIVDQPGQYVLFTDDALMPNYSGAAMRDGQPVGRRVSAPVFPGMTAAQGIMAGTAAPGGVLNPSEGNDLSLVITLAQDNPTNPFRHMFHPDHKVPDQSYQVLRDITMTFSDDDPDGRPITGVPGLDWGSSEIGGIYKETITGLHRDYLYVEGTFLLHKVSNVSTLTTQ